MNLRYELYILKYGSEEAAKARMAEEARQDAINEAENNRRNRAIWDSEAEAMRMEQTASAAKLEAVTVTTPAPAAQIDETDHDEKLAKLFDPKPVEALEKMFPAEGRWAGWAEKAKANGLINARISRGMFNPYKAGVWFVNKGAEGWDDARLCRALANNLPARSHAEAHLLTGGID